MAHRQADALGTLARTSGALVCGVIEVICVHLHTGAVSTDRDADSHGTCVTRARRDSSHIVPQMEVVHWVVDLLGTLS